MIGRTNARRGARRIFAVLQNRRLNQHIAYTIIDEVSSSTSLFEFSPLMTSLVLGLRCTLSRVKCKRGDVKKFVSHTRIILYD